MKKVCARVQVRSAAGQMLEASHPSPNSKISTGEGWGSRGRRRHTTRTRCRQITFTYGKMGWCLSKCVCVCVVPKYLHFSEMIHVLYFW